VIWHLVEVWLLVVLTFVVGCLAGAHLYNLLAGSRLAIAQGIAADAIGDVLDRTKARIGLAPAWRPVHLKGVERTWPAEPAEPDPALDDLSEIDEPGDEPEPVVAAGPTRKAVEATGAHTARIAARTPRTAPVRRPDPPRVQPPAAGLPTPMRPAGLSAARGGVPDSLQRIKGIGKRNEELLNSLGIYHFGQIAAWTPSEVLWIGQYLAFPERIQKDNWVGQATLLAMGTETGFQKSAERRRERRRRERAFGERLANASLFQDDTVEDGERDPDDDVPLPDEDDAEADPPADDGSR
jgi:predicted flap endonuclease-1-like 5' DNA nuclease